ncbi:NAD-dependent epimerase/dehydratase family protein [Devosia aquimaris]|uniref:NAD-dependent epimerase/dehydratase family protein n=1 Tax=Devosia aquimaris TaxID=2866214 RepID=UPI001CD0BD74|nr:NAD-dependent epimerase/dehydratase family protein [Devosia sp. CJK-A8-3]
MVRVLITGATGFVGGHLLRLLGGREGIEPVAGVRRAGQVEDGSPVLVLGTIGEDAVPSLTGIDVVVHCAARVHVMKDKAADPLAEFRRHNVAGTLQLAERAAEDGVRRFVFLSSIKVNGESTPPGAPFTALDAPAPVDPYGISKAEAEAALRALGQRTGMEIVIVRPVLVYGPGVKGNFLSLLRWVRKGIPLPLAAINNRRSLVSVTNLCDLLVACIINPAAAGHTFLAADGESLSTSGLLTAIGASMNKPARLFWVPPELIGLVARVAGRYGQYQRLFGTLEVSIAENKTILGWAPPQSSIDGLRDTVAAFASGR